MSKANEYSAYKLGRGLTAIDAAILGRIGRTVDDWSLTAADQRDSARMQTWTDDRSPKMRPAMSAAADALELGFGLLK